VSAWPSRYVCLAACLFDPRSFLGPFSRLPLKDSVRCCLTHACFTDSRYVSPVSHLFAIVPTLPVFYYVSAS
ncbi:hypothetical protein M9458_030249, partial [Cirrhinus mrigala]